MAKSKQPAWVGKLRKQLKRAGEKDSDFSRFGADDHKYQLGPPISEETIAAFESRFGVSLPEGYRNFLLWMGNGGAGPFYGLYPLKEVEPFQFPDYSGGVICSNLMNCLDHFGLDYRGAWKLLMDDQQWTAWKREHKVIS